MVKLGWKYCCDSEGLDIIFICEKSVVTTGRQFFKTNALKKLDYKISVTLSLGIVTSKSNVFDFQKFLTFFNTIEFFNTCLLLVVFDETIANNMCSLYGRTASIPVWYNLYTCKHRAPRERFTRTRFGR